MSFGINSADVLLEIRTRLKAEKEGKYANFMRMQLTTLKAENVLGVRMPNIHTYAVELFDREEKDYFLHALPHKYFEENQLHAVLLNREPAFEKCMALVEEFLPAIDNWATCDILSPKVFHAHRKEIFVRAKKWIAHGDEYEYVVRFGIKMLMEHFLKEDFTPEVLEIVANAESAEYYTNMMRAWFFTEALCYQYEKAVPYFEQRKLDAWTHRRTIQKAVDSRKLSAETKQYLKSLRYGRGA